MRFDSSDLGLLVPIGMGLLWTFLPEQVLKFYRSFPGSGASSMTPFIMRFLGIAMIVVAAAAGVLQLLDVLTPVQANRH